jgi:hypothetical protein
MDETEQKVVDMLVGFLTNQRRDSIEIGSASKGGTVKVYFDSKDLTDAKKRIDNAVDTRDYANKKIGGGI